MSILSMDYETEVESEIDVDSLWSRATIKQPIDSDCAVIILKIHHNAFTGNKRSFDTKIWGKTMTEWVSLAFDKCPIFEIETTENADLLDTIRPHLTEHKYTAVFYADTPLLRRKIFLSCLDYTQSKGMNVCKFERGYIFKTDYIKAAEKLYSATLPAFLGLKDFMVVDSMDSLMQAQAELKKRIIDFHLQNGVQFIDATWTSVDADVIIGENTLIYPQNVLQGKTVIGDNVILQVGNTIIDSGIGDNCTIMHSVIVGSKITPNSTIEPFSYINKGIIKK